MKVVEVSYEILVLLAISDHHYHSKEIKNIQSFLSTHFDKISSKRIAILYSEIQMLNSEKKLLRLLDIAEFFKDSVNIRNKLRMVNYALELIIIDHKVTQEERLRFKLLGEYWNIDLQNFIDKKLKKITK